MKISVSAMAVAMGVLFSATAFAQTAGSEVQRDINQQKRIEQGLQSGQLTTQEASKLEREESKVEKMESKALKDGQLNAKEKNRIERAQNQVSKDIYREKHDVQTGNPNSVSSQRMQADVQRNINQQQRIKQGIQSGELTNKEVGKLEHGQSKVNRSEARAGADGQIAAAEQRGIQHNENRQSRRIYKQKHDAQTR